MKSDSGLGIALECAQQHVTAPPPGGHQKEHDRGDHKRKPAAFEHFHHVHADKRQVDHDEHSGDAEAYGQAPAPDFAHRQKHQHRRQQHGCRHRDTECRGEIVGGSKAERKVERQGHQRPVDEADIDLAVAGGRGLEDMQARAQPNPPRRNKSASRYIL
jgi:hypothetical protein